ncbi:MAG: hypothetical protein LJE68_17450 [Rhodobacter sp.]|jgi:hypothetical protein|nr:hypothetical protein [Rhodobacter sp.]
MPEQTCGFVFAASGAGFSDLAAQAAHSLRATHPGAQIDLFTDQTDVSDPFDRVVALEQSGRRPKFESLSRSRFDRTIYLDVDVFVLADISDVFGILDRFDIAAAHDQHLNNGHCAQFWRMPMPAAFPHLNSGVIATKRGPVTDKLFRDCDQAYRDSELGIDQPIFRELVYLSEARLAVLPAQYNTMNLQLVEAYDHDQPAPRVMHMSLLHRHLNTDLPRVSTPRQAAGPQMWAQIQRLLQADRALGGTPGFRVTRLCDRGVTGQLRRFWLNLSTDFVRRRR